MRNQEIAWVGVLTAIALSVVAVGGCRRDESKTSRAGGDSKKSAEIAPQPVPAAADRREADPTTNATRGDRPSPPVAAHTSEPTEAGLVGEPSEGEQAEESQGMPKAIKVTPLQVAAMRLVPQWAQIESVSARVRATFVRLDENEKRYATNGTRDLLKQEGKTLGRSDLLGQGMYKTKDPETPYMAAGQRLTVFSDGRFLHIIEEQPDFTRVTKEWSHHMRFPHLGGEQLFSVLSKLHNVEVLPDDDVGGRRAFVFEGTFREGKGRASHWLDKESGMLLKMVVEYDEMKATFTYELSDIQFNIGFSEDHFTFTPPEGIEIQDLTQRTASQPDDASIEP